VTSLSDGFEGGKNILEQGNIFLRKQDEGLLEFDPLGFGIGDEIRREVTVVEPHACGNFNFILDGAFLLQGDHTLLSDLFRSQCDKVADVDVTVGGDGGDLHDFGGGGNEISVGREEFKDMVDGGLETSAKIHGL